MVTAAAYAEDEIRLDYLSGTQRAQGLDRWIFVITAAWFIAIILAGFVPDSLGKVAAIQSGQAHPFPIVEHMHAVLMGSFMLLLLAQTTLVATGRRNFHRQLGMISFALVPAMVIVGFILLSTIYHAAWNAASPGTGPQQFVPDNILLFQFRAGILFPLFMIIGLQARATNAGLHKRMMVLAPAMALGAAINRIPWLPNTFPISPLGSDLYMLLAVMPLIVWDVIRNRRVHEAYWIWFGVNVPFAMAVHGLWGTPWWHTIAQRIMGV